MARTFNGSSNYLRAVTAALTATPLTLAAWVKPSTVASGPYSIFGINDGAASLNGWWLRVDSGGTLNAFVGNGSAANAGAKSGVGTGTWQHVVGVYASATSRTAYLNGSAGTTDTASNTPTSVTETDVGVYNLNNGPGQYFWNGDLAELAAWNVALDAAEIAALTAGVSPLLVRLPALVFYAPLLGQFSPEIELMRARGLTVSGATAVAHPRIIAAAGPLVIAKPAVVAATGTGRMFQVF